MNLDEERAESKRLIDEANELLDKSMKIIEKQNKEYRLLLDEAMNIVKFLTENDGGTIIIRKQAVVTKFLRWIEEHV